MHVADRVRLGEAEQVVVTADVPVVVGQPRAPEVRLAERVALEQGAHRTVQHEDPLTEQPGQALEARVPGERCGRGGLGSHRVGKSTSPAAGDLRTAGPGPCARPFGPLAGMPRWDSRAEPMPHPGEGAS